MRNNKFSLPRNQRIVILLVVANRAREHRVVPDPVVVQLKA